MYDSFGASRLIIKPSSFKNNAMLTRLEFNDSTKFLVEDRITLDNFLCSYEADADTYIVRDSYDPGVEKRYTEYTQDMFTEFVNNIFRSNSYLTSMDMALANI